MMRASFRVDLSRIRNKIGEGVKVKAERVTQKLVDSFIKDSPVYTGNFRASWHVSEGFPVYVQVKDGNPSNPISAPKIIVKPRNNFPIFFITNGQPYGRKLEYGSSTQAPNGIIRINIASLR